MSSAAVITGSARNIQPKTVNISDLDPCFEEVKVTQHALCRVQRDLTAGLVPQRAISPTKVSVGRES